MEISLLVIFAKIWPNYSTGYFSENGPFLKMAITQKFELGIGSNFLHSIRTSICIMVHIVTCFSLPWSVESLLGSREPFGH